MILQRQFLEVIRTLGDAVFRAVAQASPSERRQALMTNAFTVAEGLYQAPDEADETADGYATDAMAFNIAHEFAHIFEGDIHLEDVDLEVSRAFEQTADRIGARWATESGHSPVGQAAVILLNVAQEEMAGHSGVHGHLPWIERYDGWYQVVAQSVGPGSKELENVPTPQEVGDFFAEQNALRAEGLRVRRHVRRSNPEGFAELQARSEQLTRADYYRALIALAQPPADP